MGVGKDEWEKAREEQEDRKAARSVIEAAEAVSRRVGEQELQRINRFRQAGFWMIGLGLLAVGLTLLNLLYSVGKSWLSRVAPWAVIDWEPPLGGGLTLLGVGVGVGIALLVVGALVVRSVERRLRRAAGSDEDADAAFMYLTLGSEAWEKMAGQVAEASGEVGEEAAPPRVAARPTPPVVERDEWEHRHWLRVELSGAHLIWWLSFLATTLYLLSPLWLLLRSPPTPYEVEAMLRWWPPDWLINGLFAIAAVGVLLKAIVPFFWVAAWDSAGRNPDTYRELKRYYRFWAKGLLPAALALAPAVIYWGVHSLLWA
jgi:hypothetical protein